MTIEEIKRRAELYFAMAEGKTIQIKHKLGEWVDVEPEKIDCIPETIAFRIKPEIKYRPFKTQEECWQEMLKHEPFAWIYDKNNNVNVSICFIDKKGVSLTGNVTLPFDELYDNFVFDDGTPFGIKEE